MPVPKIAKGAKALVSAEAGLTDRLAQGRDGAAGRVVDRVGGLGDQPELRALSLGLAAAGLAFGSGRLSRAGVRMFLAHELATAIKKVVKGRVDRVRPRSAKSRRQSQPRPGKRKDKAHSSFPSGHAAGSLAVAQGFAREFPEHGSAARIAATLVGAAQVPRSAHYPTDVGVGAAIGLLAEAVVAAAWRAFARRFSPKPAMPPPPPLA